MAVYRVRRNQNVRILVPPNENRPIAAQQTEIKVSPEKSSFCLHHIFRLLIQFNVSIHIVHENGSLVYSAVIMLPNMVVSRGRAPGSVIDIKPGNPGQPRKQCLVAQRNHTTFTSNHVVFVGEKTIHLCEISFGCLSFIKDLL